MITARRAQQFHDLVEDPSTGAGLGTSSARRYAGLIEVVDGLRAVPAPTPDPAYVASLRDRLVAEAETLLAAAAAERHDTDARLRLRPTTRQARRRQRRLAAAVSGLALVGVSTTVAVASQSALPGDQLYSIKRGIENAHAELTFDRAARGRVLLSDASTRLSEARALSREQADPALVNDALTAFAQEAVQGSDLLISQYDATGDRSSITTVRSFTASSMDQLRQLQSQVQPTSLDSLLQAAQALDQVQQTALSTCPSCQGPAIGAVPSVLVQAAAATAHSWPAVPSGSTGAGTHQGSGSGHVSTHSGSGTPTLPHLPQHLPPASVTNPGSTGTGSLSAPTAGSVQHTVQHLTAGLTHRHQNDVASTVTDTADNLLDAVGALGNQVAGAVQGVVGGIQSALPTLP